MSGGGDLSGLAFSTEDRLNTGRPIRIRLASAPSDGNALILQELGGYAAPHAPLSTQKSP